MSNAKTRGGNGLQLLPIGAAVLTGGDWQNLSGSTIGGLANGNSVRIKFRQVAPGASYAAIGPEVQADAVTLYGPPKQPKLEASAISGGFISSGQLRSTTAAPRDQDRAHGRFQQLQPHRSRGIHEDHRNCR